jgi:hypothetical protein
VVVRDLPVLREVFGQSVLREVFGQSVGYGTDPALLAAALVSAVKEPGQDRAAAGRRRRRTGEAAARRHEELYRALLQR